MEYIDQSNPTPKALPEETLTHCWGLTAGILIGLIRKTERSEANYRSQRLFMGGFCAPSCCCPVRLQQLLMGQGILR